MCSLFSGRSSLGLTLEAPSARLTAALDLFSEVLRLKWAVIACLGILLASVITAAATGHRIATPVRRLAEGAKRVHALDLDNVPQIPGSFFREINDAAASFNSMLDGLRWFERYVPKPLVSRLMSVRGADAIQSVERTVTVMFTDIAAFTSLSENVPAAEVADLLNRHFTLVAGCIEAETCRDDGGERCRGRDARQAEVE